MWFLFVSKDLRTRRADGECSTPKASRLETHKEPVFQSEYENQRRPESQLQAVRQEEFHLTQPFLLPADFHLIG